MGLGLSKIEKLRTNLEMLAFLKIRNILGNSEASLYCWREVLCGFGAARKVSPFLWVQVLERIGVGPLDPPVRKMSLSGARPLAVLRHSLASGDADRLSKSQANYGWQCARSVR